MKIKITDPRILIAAACFFMVTAFSVRHVKYDLIKDEAIVKVEPGNNAVTVSVKTSKYNKIQFYMFTIEGRLIKELSMNGSQKVSITQLEKGFYMYEFFNNDERLKSGQIELK